MKKRFCLILFFCSLYSFDYLKKIYDVSGYFRDARNYFSNTVSTFRSDFDFLNVKNSLPILFAGSGFALLRDRPYLGGFFLSGLLFFHIKKKRELQQKLYEEHEKEISKIKKDLQKEIDSLNQQYAQYKDQSNSDKKDLEMKLKNSSQRAEQLLQELSNKEERNEKSKEKERLERVHDNNIIDSLRRQNLSLLQLFNNLHQKYQSYETGKQTEESKKIRQILFQSLFSPLFFFKKTNRAIY